MSFGIPQRLKRDKPTCLQDFARIADTIHSTHVSHATHLLDTLANVDEVRDPCGRRLQTKHHRKPSNGETEIDVIWDDGVFGEGSFHIAHICVGCAGFC